MYTRVNSTSNQHLKHSRWEILTQVVRTRIEIILGYLPENKQHSKIINVTHEILIDLNTKSLVLLIIIACNEMAHLTEFYF